MSLKSPVADRATPTNVALVLQPAKTAPMDVSWDDKRYAELVARAKKQIRARMKALRSGYGEAALLKRSERIVQRLRERPEIAQAQGVASFWPMPGRGEVDLRPLDSHLRESGRRVYYPFMDPAPGGGFTTGFRRVDAAEDMVERGRGFPEPPPSAPLARRGDIDVVVVPALAADAAGHRIGYGAGYYDATLGDVCPPAKSIIVAYQFQLMAELPHEPHDVPCHVVLGDEKTYEV